MYGWSESGSGGEQARSNPLQHVCAIIFPWKKRKCSEAHEVSINNNNKAAAERKAKIKIKKFFECMLLFEVPEHRLVSRIWHLSAVESFLETNSHAHCLSSSRRDQSTVTFCFYLPSLLTPSENEATTLMVHGKLHE